MTKAIAVQCTIIADYLFFENGLKPASIELNSIDITNIFAELF